MVSLIKFMYNGEVQIPEERIKDFLKTAETLQIRGLMDRTNVQPEESIAKKEPSVSLNVIFCLLLINELGKQFHF